MPVSHEQTLRFAKRLCVDNDTLRFIVNEARQRHLKLLAILIDRPGRQNQVNSESELDAGLGTAEISGAHEVALYFDGDDKGKFSVKFERLLPSGPHKAAASPSYIRSSSSDPNFAYSLVGLRAQLETIFQDTQPPTDHRFTSCVPADTFLSNSLLEEPPLRYERVDQVLERSGQGTVENSPVVLPPDQGKPVRDPKPLAPRKWRWLAPATIMGILAVGVATWQGRTGERQADTADHQAVTGDRAFSLDGSAVFKAKQIAIPLTKEGKERFVIHHEQPFTIEVQNVGRGIATNTHLRCGDKSDHGLYGDLGTIAPGPPTTISSWLSSDKSDPCTSVICYAPSSTISLTMTRVVMM